MFIIDSLLKCFVSQYDQKTMFNNCDLLNTSACFHCITFARIELFYLPKSKHPPLCIKLIWRLPLDLQYYHSNRIWHNTTWRKKFSEFEVNFKREHRLHRHTQATAYINALLLKRCASENTHFHFLLFLRLYANQSRTLLSQSQFQSIDQTRLSMGMRTK